MFSCFFVIPGCIDQSKNQKRLVLFVFLMNETQKNKTRWKPKKHLSGWSKNQKDSPQSFVFLFFGFDVALGLALSSTYYYHRSRFFQHRVVDLLKQIIESLPNKRVYSRWTSTGHRRGRDWKRTTTTLTCGHGVGLNVSQKEWSTVWCDVTDWLTDWNDLIGLSDCLKCLTDFL